MTDPFAEALPVIPFTDWEMTKTGYYDDGAVYYFENEFWQLRANSVNERIVFKRKTHANAVQVDASEPIVTRAYGIMLYIDSCYNNGINQTT